MTRRLRSKPRWRSFQRPWMRRSTFGGTGGNLLIWQQPLWGHSGRRGLLIPYRQCQCEMLLLPASRKKHEARRKGEPEMVLKFKAKASLTSLPHGAKINNSILFESPSDLVNIPPQLMSVGVSEYLPVDSCAISPPFFRGDIFVLTRRQCTTLPRVLPDRNGS
jgi:hypothetical protein